MDPLLAIDIGNTHIKLGLWLDGSWREEWRLSTDVRRTADEYRISLHSLLHQVGLEGVRRCAIASVVPLLTPIFMRVGEVLSELPPIEIQPPGYGMAVDYVPPDSLGADRFVNALAAWHKVQAAVVVVDVGTTATVDAVSWEGRFLGGAIAPGPHFLAQALAQGTAKLPLVAPTIPDLALGRNTAAAVSVGVGHGFVGMVRELVTRTWKALGEEAPVVLTGGWSQRLLPWLHFPARLEPKLTLDGLRYAVEWLEREGRPE
ncbi:MAG: type III pantothenate kinase [Firmicutes bacterium]|nr:type III pantothenate kinase [Alicyclobacillaceae bacterium]MCL6497154.1 type III pantothenate kinase [Bacillota bacterium]